MKAISLLQPWATLVVIGAKKIETRPWNTKYRGELLVHASAGLKGLTMMKNDSDSEFNKMVATVGFKKYEEFPLGAIIGKVTLTNVLSISCVVEYDPEWTQVDKTEFSKGGAMLKLSKQETAFGDYSYGRYAWLLSNPVQFEKPIPAKGSLSIWNYDLQIPGR